MSRLLAAPTMAIAAIAMSLHAPVTAQDAASARQSTARATLAPSELRELAIDAYVYGYPLVTMEMTRRVMTNVETPVGTRAPMGQFVRMRSYPTAEFRDVTAPNADTLYTTAWIDVSKEPWILSLPDFGDRFFLMPMLDGWTEVFQVPGARTTGGKAAKYAITGPGWSGSLPDGVIRYDSPTAIVWILGRIYCTGTPEDYAAVHALQDAMSLVPLGAFGGSHVPPAGRVDPSIDMKTAVRDQVDRMDAASYFTLLAMLLKDNPPSPADAPMVAKLTRLGIVPGQPFSIDRLGPGAADVLRDVPKTAVDRILGYFREAGRPENGWIFSTRTGRYGTDYLNRAMITAIGLGANRPEDAVYPTSELSAAGKPYDGSKSYRMRFEKGLFPPVRGFWSLTMYDANFFFVANPLNRYTLGSRSRFVPNPDGSVELLIQHDDPGPERRANWLPAPKGRFILMLRLYWPNDKAPSILDGSWTIPAVVETSSGS